MFSANVVSLREFYASPLGDQARALIAHNIHQLWPEAKDESVLGIGFATPYLESYLAQKNTVIACMPARQGGSYWPPGHDNLSLLAHESAAAAAAAAWLNRRRARVAPVCRHADRRFRAAGRNRLDELLAMGTEGGTGCIPARRFTSTGCCG